MLERMLINKMENRIILGVTAFVGIMLLVGWVAINENARMDSFERQYQARSIERGAELFAANCSTCHGTDGRGIGGRAPGLNSPHFFGYDYLGPLNRQIDDLRREQSRLNDERIALVTEQIDLEGSEDEADQERLAEIDERLAEIEERLNGEENIQTELAALIDERAALAQELQAAILRGYPLEMSGTDIAMMMDPLGNEVPAYQPSRLNQVAWQGTLDAFIFTTLVHGRPPSISYWAGNQMQAWSQDAGGPLRDDQIEDLVNYILNWDKGEDWTIADANLVNQYAIVPGQGGGEGGVDVAGTDVEAILAQLEEIEGDAERGEALYTGQTLPAGGVILGCSGCHNNGAQGPATVEKWDDAHTVRMEAPELEGYTPLQYLVESIVAPNVYVVPGWQSGQMNANYGTELMSVQDIADVLAHLETFSSE